MSEVAVSRLENIIIFGASSFLGRSLREAFLNMGVTVYAVFRKSSNNDEVKFNDTEHHIFFEGDSTSLSGFEILSKDKTVVINCCGATGLPDEVGNLTSILEANMGMTAKILQFMAEFNFKKLIITESYWQFDEFGSESGNTLYAVAKNMQSLLVKYFAGKHAVDAAGLVLYDVYGETDSRPKMLNNLAQSIALNKNVDLTSGNQFIDFIHISDVVEAYKSTAKYLVDPKLSINSFFTRFYVRTNEPLVTLKSKISETLSVLGYEAKLTWSARAFPDHQIYRPFWPNHPDVFVPNWHSKVLFHRGLKRLINKYEK